MEQEEKDSERRRSLGSSLESCCWPSKATGARSLRIPAASGAPLSPAKLKARSESKPIFQCVPRMSTWPEVQKISKLANSAFYILFVQPECCQILEKLQFLCCRKQRRPPPNSSREMMDFWPIFPWVPLAWDAVVLSQYEFSGQPATQSWRAMMYYEHFLQAYYIHEYFSIFILVSDFRFSIVRNLKYTSVL